MRYISISLWFMVFAIILCLQHLSAQDTILVNPGYGTLNTVINEYKTSKIYKLQAGEKYVLSSTIEVSRRTMGVSDKTLSIIGEKTTDMPPVIQVGNAMDGSVLPLMFKLYDDFKIKNVFLACQDESGKACNGILSLESRIKLIIDNCVIDPAGFSRTFGGGDQADLSVFYLTNSQVFRNGKMDTPNDGGWLGSMAWDTLWVENNTFVSSGQDFIGTPFHNQPNNQFIWINHNTFLWHDVWVKKSFNDQNFYFTNNLMHDISLFPELPRWYQFFPDFESGNTLLCQAAVDTLKIDGINESLPSVRKAFWAYNLMYYSPEIKDLPRYAAENGKELTYLIPIIWDENVPLSYTGGVEIDSMENSCRETRIFNDPANWPFMKCINNQYDTDPYYSDQMIYNLNDSAGTHLLGFYRGQFWNEPDAPSVSELPSYNWDIDAWNNVDPANYPQTWPRFNGSYTNDGLLEASIEGLPLGDLNWFPEKKMEWKYNEPEIRKHILDLKVEKFSLVQPVISENEKANNFNELFEVYPNPSSNWIIIKTPKNDNYRAQLIDILGNVCIETLINANVSKINLEELPSGIYFVRILNNDKQFVCKVFLNK